MEKEIIAGEIGRGGAGVVMPTSMRMEIMMNKEWV